jgi:Ca-activated chloride channel family protein
MSSVVGAQNVKEVRRYVKRGNKMMHTGQRDKAYEQYRKAFELDSANTLVCYNMGTSMYPEEWKIMKQDAKRDSVMTGLFQHAGDPHAQDNPLRRSMAFHNLGVMHQIRANQSGEDQQKYQQLQQAIEYYKQALRNNPQDDEARYNLVLCQRQLPKGNGQGQQNPEGDKQQEQQDKQEQQQQQQQQQQQKQEQPPQQQEQQNQEWIEQMLNAAEQREKQTRRRLDEKQQGQPQRRQNEKNW